MTFQLTAIGYIVIAVTAALLVLRPGWLIGWTLFLSVFQAAAVIVVNLGAHYPVGLQPCFFAAPVAILALLLSRRPSRWIPAPVARLCLPLFLFAVFAVGSAILFPRVFAGLLVVNPRGLLEPLRPALTQLSAALYLVCCCLYFLAVAGKAAADGDQAAGRRLVDWFLAGAVVAALVGFYQVFAARAGLPYPHQFFNSNPGYSQRFGDTVDHLQRLTGTFTEASVAAWYFGAATVYCLWQALFARRRGLYLAALALCGVALLRTESSTAYLLVIGIALLVGVRLLWLRRVTATTIGALMAAMVLLGGGVVWALRDQRFVRRMLDVLLFRKSRSISYVARTLSDRAAWHALVATRGWGAGWGSLRASSLAATLLGTVGVIGALLALWFALRLARLEWRIRSLDRMRFPHREGMIAALAAMMGAGFVSVTDMIYYLPFWALVAVYAVNVWHETEARRGIRATSASRESVRASALAAWR